MNRAADYLKSAAKPLVPAVVLIEGDSHIYIERGAAGLKRAKRFISIMSNPMNWLHMALAVTKHNLLIWPVACDEQEYTRLASRSAVDGREV